MPPHTTLPDAEGQLLVQYSPMSPPNWGVVGASFHVFVYANAQIALKALVQALTTIHAQLLESGAAKLLHDNLLYRGQADSEARFLPSRLRGPRRQPSPRQRYGTDGPPEALKHHGRWYEEIEEFRTIEASIEELTDATLQERDELERMAIERASTIDRIASLDHFQRRAAVRHYGSIPSPLLDVTTSPEVAAFFATGGGGSAPPKPGSIGMLWAIDLNFLGQLFDVRIATVHGGLKTVLTPDFNSWGDNKKFFEDYGVQPAALEIRSVALPFGRPQAQHARFLSITGPDGAPLPRKTEATWWSILERYAFAASAAFLQDGNTYENAAHNITKAALLPDDEGLTNAVHAAVSK
jgi:hypothetical protein